MAVMRMVVLAFGGPLRIVAGAGTGMVSEAIKKDP